MKNLMFSKLNKNNIVSYIEDIFECRGNEIYAGEDVTISKHMLQSGTIAKKRKLSNEIVVASLLHDIGHFNSAFGMFTMDDKKDRFHEAMGAKILKPFFPQIIVDCVYFHVSAKRYLTAINENYKSNLSKASKHSLKLQGGPMKAKEIEEFEKNPNLNAIIQVRYIDDEGKDPKMETFPFSYFAPLIEENINK